MRGNILNKPLFHALWILCALSLFFCSCQKDTVGEFKKIADGNVESIKFLAEQALEEIDKYNAGKTDKFSTLISLEAIQQVIEEDLDELGEDHELRKNEKDPERSLEMARIELEAVNETFWIKWDLNAYIAAMKSELEEFMKEHEKDLRDSVAGKKR